MNSYKPQKHKKMEKTIIEMYGYTEYLNWLDVQDAIETEFTDNLELILN